MKGGSFSRISRLTCMLLLARLAETLSVSLPDRARAQSDQAAERDEEHEAIERALAAATERWPGATAPPERFVLHLAAHLRGLWDGASERPTFAELCAAIRSLALEDVYLAFACLDGDAVALTHLSATVLPEVDRAYRRFRDLPISLDDARQRILDRLLLGESPALGRYGGRGPLTAWMRVLSLRFLLNVHSRETHEVPVDEPFFEALGDAGELPLLKEEYRAAFSAAFHAAVASLSNRQRSLLRYAFHDGLNVSEIGKIYRVHRATAARWIAEARERLVDVTYDELLTRVDFTAGDLASIVRAAMSQVDSTLARYFATPSTPRR